MLVKYIFVTDLINLRKIADFIGYVYKQNMDHGSGNYNFQLCREYADRTEQIIKIIRIGYGILGIFASSLTFIEFIHTGKLLMPLCNYFPGVDESSPIGQGFLAAYNLLVITYSLLIFMPVDSLVCIIFVNMGLVSSIIINHLAEMRNALLDPDCSKLDIRKRMINIICMHQKYKE